MLSLPSRRQRLDASCHPHRYTLQKHHLFPALFQSRIFVAFCACAVFEVLTFLLDAINSTTMAKSSEIDALFAQPKKQASAPTPAAAKKRKAAPVAAASSSSAKPSSKSTSSPVKSSKPVKRQVTVVQDPSAAVAPALAPVAKRKKAAPAPALPKDAAEFTDSRGTTRRKTDDGLAIYSESELKLGQGGDTPLCPFDCDCCKCTFPSS